MSKPVSRKTILAAYKDALGGPAGEVVLDDLAAAAHMGRTTHVAGDPYESAFREGARAFYLFVKSRLDEALGRTERPEVAEKEE